MTKARDLAGAANSAVNSTEIGYLDGVTSSVQTQLDAKIAKSLVDAKGDLVAATAADTVDRLAVGSNGETLVADSSATTGLRWQGNFAAGKNKIINGDFGIWQRSTSATVTTEDYMAADRFRTVYVAGGATTTWSRQAFTPGTAPVAGYEGQYFSRIASTSGSGTTVIGISQRIENVQTFAGQTATISFWAKADSARTATLLISQIFGTGGSSGVNVYVTTQALTTSWARYSFTVSMDSIAGKTIGTGSYVVAYIYYNTGAASGSPQLDIWGVQFEAGSVATAFQTATGTLAGELAACQRYYFRLGNDNTAVNRSICTGAAYASNDASGVVQFPTTMRTTPTLDATSGTNYYGFMANSATDGFNSFTLGYADRTSAIIYNASQISQTAGHAGQFVTQSASASVAFSSEL